eukprot:759935-Hanusia_phi.AAC.8
MQGFTRSREDVRRLRECFVHYVEVVNHDDNGLTIKFTSKQVNRWEETEREKEGRKEGGVSGMHQTCANAMVTRCEGCSARSDWYDVSSCKQHQLCHE